MLTETAASVASADSTADLVYYILASLGGVGAAAIGGVRIMIRLRAKWTREGEQRAAATAVIEANTKAAEANTAAIGDLGKKFDRFADSVHEQFDQVRAELNGHGARITRIELQQGIGPGGPNGTGH